jgi:hypothetical protein
MRNNPRITNVINYVRSFFTREEPEDQVQTEDNNNEDNRATERSSRIFGIINNLSQNQLRMILRRDDNDSEESEGRHYYYLDDEADSHDELNNPTDDEEYIDFRAYPLAINWDDIKDEKSDAYTFYDKYGYFGANIYSQFNDIISFSSSRFETQIIEEYTNLKSNEDITQFINKLPQLEKVRTLLYKNMFNKKEIVMIKIYFDILGNFYEKNDHPLFKVYGFNVRFWFMNLCLQICCFIQFYRIRKFYTFMRSLMGA